ncbi:hypothetical protein IPL85_00240 [Candidatus Saccharibacteria bacterium]|nr:MAG: hypothetical protein IPL85_00240 [Candidatus Saccharibacteria bacterium]
MKQAIRLSLLVALAVVLTASPAFAASKPSSPRTVSPLGIDISYPQCKKTVPSSQAFGIVGVNGGTAAKPNPCLAKQLTWASKSTGYGSQDKIQLYVNTASPGSYISSIDTWPTSNADPSNFTPFNPYGSCLGTDTTACAWQYGWNRAYAAVNEYFTPAAKQAGIDHDSSKYVWWLDVETINTWHDGSEFEGFEKNVASLEGMTSYYDAIGAKAVGLYSTNYQWGLIVGDAVGETSVLQNRNTWYALGSATKETAKAACTSDKYHPLTKSSAIVLTQFVANNLDYNHSCV